MLSSALGRRCFPPARVTPWLGVLVVAMVSSAAAQFDCLEFSPPVLFDTSGDPTASPDNPRSRGAEVFSWGGHQYLIHGTGNELEVFQVDDPEQPGPGRDSNFQVPPYGKVSKVMNHSSMFGTNLYLHRHG